MPHAVLARFGVFAPRYDHMPDYADQMKIEYKIKLKKIEETTTDYFDNFFYHKTGGIFGSNFETSVPCWERNKRVIIPDALLIQYIEYYT